MQIRWLCILQDNGFECPLCKVLVSHLKADMEDPDMQEKILARVEQVRSNLSP